MYLQHKRCQQRQLLGLFCTPCCTVLCPLMSRQTNHPLKTQSPHLLSLYTTRRVKRVMCRYRAAALQWSRLATPNGGHTGYFRSKPWNHKSRLVHSRCFSGSISRLLMRFRARPCLHANANVRSLVNAGPQST
jgi:hypothetical protein